MAIIHNHLGSNIAGLIFLGAAACGKDTQSELILDPYDGSDICVGNEIRAKMNSDAEFQRLYGHIVRNGKLLPDEIALRLTQGRARSIPHKGLIVVNGFSRNKHQADMLDRVFTHPRNLLAVEFVVDIDTALERAKGRNREDDEKVKYRFSLWKDNRKETVRKLSSKGVKIVEIDGRKSKEEVFAELMEYTKEYVKMLKRNTPRPQVRQPHPHGIRH